MFYNRKFYIATEFTVFLVIPVSIRYYSVNLNFKTIFASDYLSRLQKIVLFNKIFLFKGYILN